MSYEGYIARFIGWFSLGLGTAEVVAPRQMGRLIGVGDGTQEQLLMRAAGLREIASGVGIFMQRRPTPFLWARVAGDAMDLSLLALASRSDSAQRARIAAAAGAVAGVAALDVVSSLQFSTRPGLTTAGEQGVPVIKTVTVGRPADELYRFWHDFQNLPRFMSHLESVQVMSDRRSHWRARGPAGTTMEWDAEMVEDRPNELIAWRSLPGADVDNAGSVQFAPAPAGRGTWVRVEMWYNPPAGLVGVGAAKLFGEEPAQQVSGELRAFKQLMETGEVVQSDSTVGHGHPARPPAHAAH